jgi:ABC-type branched-subunit amino acid transport system ATPase component
MVRLPSLQVGNLSNRFGDSAALTKISFSAREKEIADIIGRNHLQRQSSTLGTIFLVLFLVRSEFGPKQIALSISIVIPP